MGRHGLKFCILCNPEGNGTTGYEGTEAIGKYYLYPDPRSVSSGWQPVCEDCAYDVEYRFQVHPLKGHEKDDYFERKRKKAEELSPSKGEFKHRWIKMKMGMDDHKGMYDLWQCEKCKIEVKGRGIASRPDENGCTVS